MENDGKSDAGDRVASEGEVRAALSELEHAAVATARLAAAAEAILRRHPRLVHVGPQDLIQEALFRTLQCRRRWRPTKIDFLGHVIGAMRSIASAATKSAARSTVQADSLEVISDDGDAWEVVPAEPTPSVEDTLIDNEQRALADAQLDAFHLELAKDAKALAVYEHLCRDMPKREIRVALGMTATEFWTVDRRLSRLIDRLSKTDGEHQ